MGDDREAALAELIDTFYDRREYRHAWAQPPSLTAAHELLVRIAASHEDGLCPMRYDRPVAAQPACPDPSILARRWRGVGQFKFDSAGRQRMVFGAYTGDGYASGWNSTGMGGQFSPSVYLKHLYLALSLGRHVGVEYGSLYPIPGNRRLRSDTTTMDTWRASA